MYRIKELLSHGWRHATTVIFIGGFAVDSFLLPDFDDPITKYIGLTYLLVLAVIIYLREWVISKNTASEMEQKLYSLLTFGVSFFSGSALSFVFIYALRSAALAVSWPLFVILIIIMVANEFISTHNYRFTLDIAVYFIAIIFYSIFHVPIVFGKVNDMVFFVSSIVAAIIGVLYISILRRSSEAAEYEQGRGFALALGIPLFVGMLYLLNVIPAVPLSLKASGIYHNITKDSQGNYTGLKEVDNRFFASWRRPVFHLTESDSGIYYFSSVSAPAELRAPITHVWEYYNEETREWVTSTTISFEVSGGRKEGYRAYSKKERMTPGMWRVTVKADDKRIIGRMRFYIVKDGNAQVEEKAL